MTVLALIGLELYPHEFHLRGVNVQIGSRRRAIFLSLCFTQAFASAFFGWSLWACVRCAEKCCRMGLLVLVRHRLGRQNDSIQCQPEGVFCSTKRRLFVAKLFAAKSPKAKMRCICCTRNRCGNSICEKAEAIVVPNHTGFDVDRLHSVT